MFKEAGRKLGNCKETLTKNKTFKIKYHGAKCVTTSWSMGNTEVAQKIPEEWGFDKGLYIRQLRILQ